MGHQRSQPTVTPRRHPARLAAGRGVDRMAQEGFAMIIEHAGRSPRIDPTAWVAPDATLCGDVVLGPGARVLHGARLIGEACGRISIGRETIVMENAVVRATARHG